MNNTGLRDASASKNVPFLVSKMHFLPRKSAAWHKCTKVACPNLYRRIPFDLDLNWPTFYTLARENTRNYKWAESFQWKHKQNLHFDQFRNWGSDISSLFILQREVWFCYTFLDFVSIGLIGDSFVIILTPKYIFPIPDFVICDILYIVCYIFVTVKR